MVKCHVQYNGDGVCQCLPSTSFCIFSDARVVKGMLNLGCSCLPQSQTSYQLDFPSLSGQLNMVYVQQHWTVVATVDTSSTWYSICQLIHVNMVCCVCQHKTCQLGILFINVIHVKMVFYLSTQYMCQHGISLCQRNTCQHGISLCQ